MLTSSSRTYEHPMNRRVQHLTRHADHFHSLGGGLVLRPYQLEPFLAIIDSVRHGRGLTFVVIFPRQSGKNETQATLFAYLLYHAQRVGGEIVSVAPTYKPQTENAIFRLGQRLGSNVLTRGRFRKAGYIFSLGAARVSFFSGEAGAKVMGATASLLLSVDEAQDVGIAKYDRDFEPMAASTNATRVFWGTRWTKDTLLERELTAARLAQEQDGRQRVFFLTGEQVAAALPPYAEHLRAVVRKHGRNHPLVKTQYFCETLDAEAGMFSQTLLSVIPAPALSTHDRQLSAEMPRAFLIDVAGQSEASPDPEAFSTGARDSTTLTICSIDVSTVPTLGAPTYHITARHSWTGTDHLAIFGQINALAENYNPRYIVIDATGVGEGLWAMLHRSHGEKVIPVKFSTQKKSEIAWRFVSIIGTGRFRDHCHTPTVAQQYANCRSEILPGPAKLVRWGVPDGTRDPNTGEPIHDDHLLADALIAEIDMLDWSIPTRTTIISAADPIQGTERAF